MLAAPCPSCGAPTRVSLAHPDRVRCRSCGHDGAPGSAVTAALQRAAELVSRRAERERQLDERTRAWVARSRLSPLVVALLGMGLSLPALGVFAMVLAFTMDGSAEPLIAMLCAGPALATPAVVCAGLYALVARRASLAQAAAAVPPPAPGEPASCRVCGGDVETGGAAVVRCGYCKADNVVRADVLARAVAHTDRAAGDLESEVARRAGTVKSAARGAMIFAVATAIIAPVLGMAFALAVAEALGEVEVETDGTEQVAVVMTPRGHCIGQVTGPEASRILWFGGRAEDGFVEPVPLAAATPLEWRATASLVGTRVRLHDGAAATVQAVRRTGVSDRDLARVSLDDGSTRDEPFGGLCLP